MHATHTMPRQALFILLLIFAAGSVFSIALTQSALTAAMLLWLVLMAVERKREWPSTPMDTAFLLYIGVGTLAGLFADGPQHWHHFVRRILLIPIVYLFAGTIRRETRLRILVMGWIGTGVVISITGIVKYLGGPGGLEGRLKLYNHYMTSGGILMIVMLMALAFVLVRISWKFRAAALGCAVVMGLPLIFTYTRSSWLGLAAGLGTMMGIANKKLVPVLLLLAILFMTAAPPSVRDRALSIFNPHHRMNVERTYMWQAGIRMIQDHPLTGVGDIDLSHVYEAYRPPGAREHTGHMHNNWIMFGVLYGIPGILVFLYLFGRMLLSEIQVKKRIPRESGFLQGVSLGAIGVFTGFHVNGMFEWNFGDAEIAMLLWMTLGLAYAASRIASANHADDPRVRIPAN